MVLDEYVVPHRNTLPVLDGDYKVVRVWLRALPPNECIVDRYGSAKLLVFLNEYLASRGSVAHGIVLATQNAEENVLDGSSIVGLLNQTQRGSFLKMSTDAYLGRRFKQWQRAHHSVLDLTKVAHVRDLRTIWHFQP